MTKREKTPLEYMVETTSTEYWNDSCSFSELEYAIEHGAVGATTNPVIVGNVLKKELPLWKATIEKLIKDNPDSTYEDIAWMLNETMAVEAGKLLLPIFNASKGKKGRISIQTNAKYYQSWEKMAERYLPTVLDRMFGVVPTNNGITQGINGYAALSIDEQQAKLNAAVEKLSKADGDYIKAIEIIADFATEFPEQYMTTKPQLLQMIETKKQQ